jgi:CheY-like chemotaxis protein
MEKKVILIAEDDEDNYFFLQVSLRGNRFSILRARNGREAIEFIEHNNRPCPDGLEDA